MARIAPYAALQKNLAAGLALRCTAQYIALQHLLRRNKPGRSIAANKPTATQRGEISMALSDNVRKAFKPASDLAVLNAETTGRLIQQQTALVLEVTEASVAQVKKLMQVESIREAIELQRDYVGDVFSMTRGTSREQLATLREAGSDAGEVLRSVFRRAREEAAEAIEPTPENAPEVAQPAAI
jgi:hypothetical protein